MGVELELDKGRVWWDYFQRGGQERTFGLNATEMVQYLENSMRSDFGINPNGDGK